MALRTAFSRSFYTFSRALFTRPRYTYWALYYWDLFIFLYCTPRLLRLYVVLNDTANVPHYQSVDPAVSFFINVDPLMTMLIWFLDVFHIIAETMITRIDVTAPVWRFWYQVIVQLQDDYHGSALNSVELEEVVKSRQQKLIYDVKHQWPVVSLLVPNWALQVAAQIAAPAVVWVKLENIHQDQFYSKKLPELPNLSNDCKKRVTLFMVVTDALTYPVQIIIAILIPPFIWVYRKEVFGGFPFYVQLWSVYEIFIIVYTTFRILHNAFFFTNASIVAALVQGGHSTAVTRELKKVIRAARAERRNHLRPMEVLKVVHFLTEHNTVCGLVVAGNRALWSSVMGDFVLTNLPLNIYAFSQIVLSATLTLIELFTLVSILSLQLVAFFVTMWPLSYTSKCLHAPQETIVALQSHLMGSGTLLLKCKLDDLKLLLSTGPKVAVTIGPAREVTEETMSELLGIYFAFLMMFFSQQLQNVGG